MPRCRRLRLPGEAGEYRTAAVCAPQLAASLRANVMLEDKVNILLVDDQPAKLLTYQAILGEIGENLLTANNATEALELLLKNDVAVVLIDVYMPDIDGFQLAAMIRNHPQIGR